MATATAAATTSPTVTPTPAGPTATPTPTGGGGSGLNILQNGDFEAGQTGWQSKNCTWSAVSPGFGGSGHAGQVVVSSGSSWELRQTNLPLEPNTAYRLRFEGKADAGRSLSVQLLKHGTPYTNYGLSESVSLDTGWQTYSYEFTTSGFSSPVNDARLRFRIYAAGVYTFDNVVLEKVDGSAPPATFTPLPAPTATATTPPGATATSPPTATASSTATATPPPSNDVAAIQRTYYTLGGQLIGVRVKELRSNGTTKSDNLYYTYTDHLGSVTALSDANGNFVSDSLALFRPFGSYRLEPTTNPGITDRGYTGHKENLSLGLTYMNARLYVGYMVQFLPSRQH